MPRNGKFGDVAPLVEASSGPLESAAELKGTSVVDASQFIAGDDDLVDKGLGAFVEKFGQGIPACLNSPVTRITYSEDGVVVEAAGKSYAAKTALVTVSVGVLQAKRITFPPELPTDKLRAIQSLTMGNMQKVIIPFKADIFRGEKQNSWVLADGAFLPEEQLMADQMGLPGAQRKRHVMAFVVKPLNTNVAIGFFGRAWAQAFEAKCKGFEHGSGPRSASGCDDLPITIATAELGRMYGEKEVAEAIQPEGIHLTRWSLDETSLGAYSVALPGRWAARQPLGEPIGGGKDV